MATCPNPFDGFRLATESLPDDIHARGTQRDIWMNLIPRSVYPHEVGLVRSTFVVGRSEPTTDEPDFDPITVTSGDTYTGSCGVTYNDINYGFDEVTYAPEQFGWRGPVICQDDLIFHWKASAFLSKYIPALAKNTIRTIGNRLMAIYTHFVPKAVANTSFSFGNPGTGTPPQSPTLTLDRALCELTQEMLDETAVILNEEGAFEPDTNGWISMGDGGPIYPLLIGQQMSHRLLLNNAELREDSRHADSGKGDMAKLFQRIGATRIIKNFRHVITAFPPRYNYAGGAYTRVPTWVMPAATKGFAAEINPAWRTADFEAALVLSPWVFHSEVITPVNAAAGLNWSPKNYAGELRFITGGHRIFDPACFDPEEKLGRHFGTYRHAPNPIFPEYGRWIVYDRRCQDQSMECISCS